MQSQFNPQKKKNKSNFCFSAAQDRVFTRGSRSKPFLRLQSVFSSLSEPEGNLCQFLIQVLEGGKIHHIVPVSALAGEGLVGLEPSPTLECGCQEESLWLEPPPPVELP